MEVLICAIRSVTHESGNQHTRRPAEARSSTTADPPAGGFLGWGNVLHACFSLACCHCRQEGVSGQGIRRGDRPKAGPWLHASATLRFCCAEKLGNHGRCTSANGGALRAMGPRLLGGPGHDPIHTYHRCWGPARGWISPKVIGALGFHTEAGESSRSKSSPAPAGRGRSNGVIIQVARPYIRVHLPVSIPRSNGPVGFGRGAE